MTLTVAMYLAYLAITVPLTIWVARTLARHGRTFLVDVFVGNSDLADSVNRLLVVGFYLVTLGFATLFLRTGAEILTLQRLVEELSWKLGLVMLALGTLHLINVRVFTLMRRRKLEPTPPRQPLLPGSPPVYRPVPPPATS